MNDMKGSPASSKASSLFLQDEYTLSAKKSKESVISPYNYSAGTISLSVLVTLPHSVTLYLLVEILSYFSIIIGIISPTLTSIEGI
jgi:hypothetical protein